MEIHVYYHDHIAIIEPQGKIMGQSVLTLRASILSHIGAADNPCIVLNFENVHQMGSSGLGMLVQANALAKQKNGRIVVIHVSKHIKNLLVVSRLSSFFEHFDDAGAAVSALSDASRTN